MDEKRSTTRRLISQSTEQQAPSDSGQIYREKMLSLSDGVGFLVCFPCPPASIPLYLSNTGEVFEVKVSHVGTGPIAVIRSVEGEQHVACTLQKGSQRRRMCRGAAGVKRSPQETPRRSKQQAQGEGVDIHVRKTAAGATLDQDHCCSAG